MDKPATNKPRAPRTEPMVLLCFGLPRTGTSSLRQALKDLGIDDVYHYNAMLENPPDCDVWCKAFDLKFGKKRSSLNWTSVEWDVLLGDCMAVTDNPPASFAPELIRAYPNAKVLLNIRDNPDVWVTSFSKTILPIEEAFHCPSRNPYVLFRRWLQPQSSLRGVVDRLVLYAPNAAIHFRKRGREMYLEHNQRIRDLMKGKEDRFLEFNVKEGWEPLCRFLEKDVPHHEFPRLNDTVEFQRIWKEEEAAYYEVDGGKIRTLMAGIVGMVAVGSWWLWKGRMMIR